jgi:hypothetical protein
MSKVAMLIIADMKRLSLAGMLMDKRGMNTISWRQFTIPHRKLREKDNKVLSRKFPPIIVCNPDSVVEI